MTIVDNATFRTRLERLEEHLWGSGFAAIDLGTAPPADEALADRVLELSDLYTLRRDRIATDAVRSSHLLARTLYFLCADAPKVHLVVDELARRGAWTPGEHLSVADLGCGVGATAVGVILSLCDTPRVTLRGVDDDAACLDVWRAAVSGAAEIAGIELDLDAREGDLSTPVRSADGATAHVTLCQAALNERIVNDGPDARHDDDTVRLVRDWTALGTTILIEPALRVATRPLQRLRDELVRDGSVRVVAPCPHQADCPMLASPRDWCHEIRTWRPTPRVDAIQRLTRRRDERLKFSFMAFKASGAARAGAEGDSIVGGRLVSDALVTKGKTERVVCVADGTLRKLRLLDRERTDGNGALADLRRGALVTIDGLSARDRIDSAVRFSRCPDRSA